MSRDIGVRRHEGAMSVAEAMHPLVDALLASDARVDISFWDGSTIARETPVGTLSLRSPRAIEHIVWAPRGLGLARAYVSGDIDVTGDAMAVIEQLRSSSPQQRSLTRVLPAIVGAVRRMGLPAHRPDVPDAEFQPPRWGVHTRGRDAAAISHHYDVSNDFYELVLGPAMTYSCAYFAPPGIGLEDAQRAKHELICRKLGLADRPGMRLLDVGCGWGSMAIQAAAEHGAHVVGITISREQSERARERVAAAGLADRVEIRLQDYRDLQGEGFDAISSVGMSEHVGRANLTRYFSVLRRCLVPQGRLLNHAISSVGGSRLPTHGFMHRYVFPDGELIDLADSIHAMQEAGFEIRDVHSLREHYEQTLRHWVANLEHNWDDAVALAGVERARTWRLYMAASAVGFADAGINVHQVLGVVNDPDGSSGMPPARPV
jgi:cyclopropane-fatty-acyl-phospholipid synthase